MRFNKIFRRSKRQWVALLALLVLTPLITVVALRGYSAWQARDTIYTFAAVPQRPVAIVFGAEIYGNGRLSAMLADRVTMGAELYRAGKVQALLLSGDNSIDTYNEPEAMRQFALGLGVPDEALVLDYAGFRTYDSCYRARDIFQVDGAILVSQDFHLDRALLVCNALGIDSVGVAADMIRSERYSARALLSSQRREIPSTALSVVDLLLGTKPTYLGDPLPILVGDVG